MIAEAQAGSTSKRLRIPAPELEATVTQTLVQFLEDKSRVTAAFTDIPAPQLDAAIREAKRIGGVLKGSSKSDQIGAFRCVASRVVVQKKTLLVTLRASALCPERPPSYAPIEISVPVELERCGMAVRLVVPANGRPATVPDQRLVALIAKGQDWLGRLTSGRYGGVADIASEEGVSSSYVTRIAYLGCISPDLADKICRGAHSLLLNADWLVRAAPFAIDWRIQERLLTSRFDA